MKYLKLFESFNESEIHEICEKYDIKNYTINQDGSININSEFGFDCVNLSHRNLKKLPLKFNKVNGWFTCSDSNLTSLEGSPKEVNGSFYCHVNYLTSFQYAPKIIRGFFNCSDNDLTSFENFPNYIKSDFNCYNNPIFGVWRLFQDVDKIELLNDFDIFRDEDTYTPIIIMDRLNDFLLTIGKDPVESIERYKNI